VVDGRPTTHLIVTPSSPYHEFDTHDQAALETLGAMGAAAFQRCRLIDETTRSARHDTLTGLYNRAVFVDHLAQTLGNTTGPGCVSVLYCDLDGFKEVNDRFGHDVGDQLLVLVSHRLEQCIRDADLAARFGGDEFGVLVSHQADEGIADVIADRVHQAVMAPYRIEGREIRVQVSIGIATSPNDSTTAEELIDAADLAMYAAKSRGKARVERFVQSMRDDARDRLELEAALRDAVLEDHIRVHYQPVVCLRTGRIEGFEALARWNHPRFGSVDPETFIAAAERVGVIRALGVQVLERAHEGTRQLARAAGHSLTLGVNVSAAQVNDPDLAERVGELIAIGPEVKLLLELTEGLLIEDNTATMRALHGFKSLGVTLALDDFGMGYSSIGYLDRLPVDVLKVDKLFVSRLHDPRSRALVEGIVAMAQALDLTVIAEGVEDWASATILRDLHCGLGQGFVFGRPMELVEALAFVSAGDRDVTAMTSASVGRQRVSQR
jgi:diguanylate cyclase (GGDEF)-like protein